MGTKLGRRSPEVLLGFAVALLLGACAQIRASAICNSLELIAMRARAAAPRAPAATRAVARVAPAGTLTTPIPAEGFRGAVEPAAARVEARVPVEVESAMRRRAAVVLAPAVSVARDPRTEVRVRTCSTPRRLYRCLDGGTLCPECMGARSPLVASRPPSADALPPFGGTCLNNRRDQWREGPDKTYAVRADDGVDVRPCSARRFRGGCLGRARRQDTVETHTPARHPDDETDVGHDRERLG